jgi:hypothetical protein
LITALASHSPLLVDRLRADKPTKPSHFCSITVRSVRDTADPQRSLPRYSRVSNWMRKAQACEVWLVWEGTASSEIDNPAVFANTNSKSSSSAMTRLALSSEGDKDDVGGTFLDMIMKMAICWILKGAN